MISQETIAQWSACAELAKGVRQVFFGGNWTSVNFKESLEDVRFEEAVQKLAGLNTIAALVYHTVYYIAAVMKVLQGGPLDARDQYSFDLPPLNDEAEWKALQEQTWKAVEAFAQAVSSLAEEKLDETFVDPKYGNYYRNLSGIIEHAHYHLGQIVLIKKLLRSGTTV